MSGSNTFFAGSIQSISRAASPQKPSGSASERAWTSWYRLLWMFMALLPLTSVYFLVKPWMAGTSPAMIRINLGPFLGAIVTGSSVNSRPDSP